ncbi:SagB/ThcOx family dehydrogenase [Fluoribacter gormanii]|uniref:SagB/ThcOx family dehydrogenase n=1 Tax=Fluoribacter gormanii TaxID=464 RepID=UPI0022441A14|nr:SagB/ThcOx family dehydrogenase [Fluoribacter gormanii]MCW8445425.1 SagB/ThcOx family dehydrogenase [Fluoribacter gormanii]MCW8470674.1 SagB/ThcOx family dehydrogenase [Fluoribacter gormanii]
MEFLRRKKIPLLIIAILSCLCLILIPKKLSREPKITPDLTPPIERVLPSPTYSSHISIEEALKKRRSIRQYKNQAITLQQVAQLLWASQGITSNEGFRTTPSAGALYPLEVYLVARNVSNLSAGVYHYVPSKHILQKIKEGDISAQLTRAALGQSTVNSGAANIVITAVFSRTIKKYGKLGNRFVFMEAGHAAQNIYLQTVSLNLATVSIGGFDDVQVKQALGITNEEPLYILPIGKK